MNPDYYLYGWQQSTLELVDETVRAVNTKGKYGAAGTRSYAKPFPITISSLCLVFYAWT